MKKIDLRRLSKAKREAVKKSIALKQKRVKWVKDYRKRAKQLGLRLRRIPSRKKSQKYEYYWVMDDG